jgi:hypothetical protein
VHQNRHVFCIIFLVHLVMPCKIVLLLFFINTQSLLVIRCKLCNTHCYTYGYRFIVPVVIDLYVILWGEGFVSPPLAAVSSHFFHPTVFHCLFFCQFFPLLMSPITVLNNHVLCHPVVTL